MADTSLVFRSLLFALYVGNLSSHAILTHRHQSSSQSFDPNVVIFYAEWAKLLISSAFFLALPGPKVSIRECIISTPVMLIPAIAYAMQNVLYYAVLKIMEPATYVIISQSRHLITAFLSFIILGKPISRIQWKALVLLTQGTILVQMKEINWRSPEQNYQSLGFVLAILQCTISAGAGVYLEKVLKLHSKRVSIWARNIQLSLCSIVIGSLYFSLYPSEKGLGDEISWDVISLIVGNTFSGILVALLVFYADSIVKNFGMTVAVILTCVFDFAFCGHKLSLNFLLGTLIVLTSLSMYRDNTVSKQEINADHLEVKKIMTASSSSEENAKIEKYSSSFSINLQNTKDLRGQLESSSSDEEEGSPLV